MDVKELRGILRLDAEAIKYQGVALEDREMAIYTWLHEAFEEFEGKYVEITIRECGETKCEARCKL